MSDEPTPARKAYGSIAPALADYTDNVLFGDVSERPGLSKRDRSLDNGISRDELVELATHLAFYSGWPTANSAVSQALAKLACASRWQG